MRFFWQSDRLPQPAPPPAKQLLAEKLACTALTDLAAELSALPKVTPRAAWRVRTRERLASQNTNWLTGWLQRLAAAGVALTLLAVLSFGPFAHTPTALAAEVGRLTATTGQVQIRAAAAVFFAPADSGAVVYAGDTIRVPADGGAELTLTDHTAVQLHAATEVAVQLRPTTAKTTPRVELAVLAGEVATKTRGAGSVAVTTAAGSVPVPAGDFAVKVDPATGHAAVAATTTTTEQPASSETATAIAATADELPALPPVAAEAVATTLDLAEIRLLDALASAENGDWQYAAGTAAQVTKTIAELTRQLTADTATPLPEVLQKNFAASSALPQLLAHAGHIGTLQNLLPYFENPVYLRGKPEFVILENSNFTINSGVLRPVFVALRASKLADPSAAQLARELASAFAAELPGQLPHSSVALARSVRELLGQVGDQPLFLPVLRELGSGLPAGSATAVHAKIAELEKLLAAHAGN